MRQILFAVAVLASVSANALNEVREIDSETLAPLAERIEKARPGPFSLYFDSPGGSVFDGLEFMRTMEAAQRRGVVFVCTADFAASMGAVIFSVCDYRFALARAVFLIHPASTTAQGNSRDLRETASLLEALSDALLRQVGRVMNITFEELKRRSEHGGYWLDAGRAKETGLVQAVLP